VYEGRDPSRLVSLSLRIRRPCHLHEVRSRHQFDHCQGAWPRRAVLSAI